MCFSVFVSMKLKTMPVIYAKGASAGDDDGDGAGSGSSGGALCIVDHFMNYVIVVLYMDYIFQMFRILKF